MMGRRPLTRSNLVAPSLQHPLYRVCQQSVDCYVLLLNDNHLRTRPHLPLYFLIGLALAPQTREPTAALPNPRARALRKPIGSSGTMSWWCRWPNHGGRGLKPVEGKAAWLLLVVVCCSCQLLYRIVHKTICRGFWQVVCTTKRRKG